MDQREMEMKIEEPNLALDLVKLEAQVHQQFHTKLEKEKKEKLLEKLMLIKSSIIRRLKRKTATYCKQIADKEISLKNMENHIKKIWTLLLAFGNNLEKLGYLAVNEKTQLHNVYKELMTLGVSHNEGLDLFNNFNDNEDPQFVPETPLNKEIQELKNAFSYPCSKETQNNEKISLVSAIESSSFDPVHQPKVLDDRPSVIGSLSSQLLNGPSYADARLANNPDEVECMQDEMEISLAQKTCTLEDTDTPVEEMEVTSERDEVECTNDETCTVTETQSFSEFDPFEDMSDDGDILVQMNEVKKDFLPQSSLQEGAVSECSPIKTLQNDLALSDDSVDAPEVSNQQVSSGSIDFNQQKTLNDSTCETLRGYHNTIVEQNRNNDSCPYFDIVDNKSCPYFDIVDNESCPYFDIVDNESSLQKVDSFEEVAGAEHATTPLLEDLKLSIGFSDAEKDANSSKDSTLPTDNSRNESKQTISAPFNLANVSEFVSDSQAATNFSDDADKKDEEMHINSLLCTTQEQNLSSQVSLARNTMSNNTHSSAGCSSFVTDNLNVSTLLKQSDSSPENSSSSVYGKYSNQTDSDSDIPIEPILYSNQNDLDSDIPIETILYSKKPSSKRYKLKTSKSVSKREKDSFDVEVLSDSFQTSLWKSKFKKIKEHLKDSPVGVSPATSFKGSPEQKLLDDFPSKSGVINIPEYPTAKKIKLSNITPQVSPMENCTTNSTHGNADISTYAINNINDCNSPLNISRSVNENLNCEVNDDCEIPNKSSSKDSPSILTIKTAKHTNSENESDVNKVISELDPSTQPIPRLTRIPKKIYTFHKGGPTTALRRAIFVSKVTNVVPETSSSENDSNLQHTVIPNQVGECPRTCERPLVDVSRISDVNIENLDCGVDSDCEILSEASTSKELTPLSMVKNKTRCKRKFKHSFDKEHIESGIDKEVVVGNYITYVKPNITNLKEINLAQTNKETDEKNRVKIRKEYKRRLLIESRLKSLFQSLSGKTYSSTPNFKYYVQKLTRVLSDPTFVSNNQELLFRTLNYITASKTDFLLSYNLHEDSATPIPFDETCIVTALFDIESKKLPHLTDLLRSAVTTIHHLILSKKKFGLFRLSALCRTLIEICKRQGNSLKPVTLCSDLLKMQHPFAPYLIATIAVVWKDLFQVENNLPAEEMLFHSAILHGVSKLSRCKLNEDHRNSVMEIVSNYFTAPIVKDAKVAISNLKNLIQMRCQDETWNSQYLTSALVILAGREDWEWIQDKLLVKFILPNLKKFGRESLNEHAFNMFCNLYVDVLLLKPGNPLDTVLRKFFLDPPTIDGDNFVKDCAALALIRFVYLKNRLLPPFLESWLQENHQKPKVQQVESLFLRRLMGEDLKSLRLQDILYIF